MVHKGWKGDLMSDQTLKLNQTHIDNIVNSILSRGESNFILQEKTDRNLDNPTELIGEP